MGSRRGRFVRDDIVSARFRREHFEQVKAAAAGSKLTASRFVAAASLFAVRERVVVAAGRDVAGRGRLMPIPGQQAADGKFLPGNRVATNGFKPGHRRSVKTGERKRTADKMRLKVQNFARFRAVDVPDIRRVADGMSLTIAEFVRAATFAAMREYRGNEGNRVLTSKGEWRDRDEVVVAPWRVRKDGKKNVAKKNLKSLRRVVPAASDAVFDRIVSGDAVMDDFDDDDLFWPRRPSDGRRVRPKAWDNRG